MLGPLVNPPMWHIEVTESSRRIAGATFAETPRSFFVASVVVDPPYQRMRIATHLYEIGFHWARKRKKKFTSGVITGPEIKRYWTKLCNEGRAIPFEDGGATKFERIK